ncbi:hypothetical protein LQ948_04475 [Jiella sp. MQZ9-1]|uniref:Uncharacterized protein n=1 Tax=Jiella flava TaxID=2816857 RepID=A0A939JUV7_9HYPH|nr:hypothetical protein [Jiella flava]MBO0661819.1 hypothetical protein [Jiella flava]MCD2470459.1 hypothetical protein [Jiella flava]
MSDVPPQLPVDAPPSDIAKELERRIAVLETARDAHKLSQEAQERDLIIKEIRQRVIVRWSALTFAVFVVVFLGILLVSASSWFTYWKFLTAPSSLVMVLFVAPIASITAITITILIGAYRRKGEDMDGSPVANLAAEAFKATGGPST